MAITHDHPSSLPADSARDADGRTQHLSALVVPVTAASHFAWLRTRMALERTLMAWVRTSISLVAFGFTLVQFFEHIADFTGARPGVEPHAPRVFGLVLMAAGTVGLALALVQHHAMRKHLRSDAFKPIAGGMPGLERHLNPSLFVTVVLFLAGVWAIAAVLVRLAP